MAKAWRNDAYSKVTGKAKYTDDLKLTNMLHCVPVYSKNFIHAKIKSINGIDEALKIPGVVKIITAQDIPGTAYFGQIFKDYFMLVTDKIRSEGDVLALVVAESRKPAIEAAKMIDVNAAELPLLLYPTAAMETTDVLIHESKGTNIINHHKIRKGKNIDKALSECDIIIEREYSTGHVEHAYLEPESALCNLRYDGVMEVYGSMQHPFSTRKFVAALLGKPLSEVEVIGIPMGGGFGGKDDTAAIVCARAALASFICKRPVKMTYDREWSMRESYKRHPYIMHYKIGLKNNKLHAIKTKIIADGGAYTSVTPWVTWRSIVQCCGPYVVDNVYCDIYGVHTNNVFTGAFRGFGSPQVNFAVEQWIEDCAKEVGMDPVEFRRKNMVKQNSETITSQKLDNHIVSLEEVMDKALKLSNYYNKFQNNTYGKDKEKQYGIGLAISYRGCSLGAEGMDFCSAIINGQFDGSILLDVGIHENGQGAESAMVKLLARELGVKRERIRYNRPSTSRIPDGGSTVASRGTLMGGGAVVNAAKILKNIISKSLADELNCKAIDVRFKDDCIWGKTDDVFLSWDDVMKRLFLHCDYPYAFGVFKGPKVSWDEEIGKGKAYFTWGYHCQIAEVEVDKNNNVRLLNAYAVHDIGKTVNHEMLLGQVYGGFTQGYGMAIMEDLNIKDGRISNLNFNRYKIPRATDIPDMKVEIVENPDPNSPSGAKGVGEPALEIAAPAVANAVHNALGKRFESYPLALKGEK